LSFCAINVALHFQLSCKYVLSFIKRYVLQDSLSCLKVWTFNFGVDSMLVFLISLFPCAYAISAGIGYINHNSISWAPSLVVIDLAHRQPGLSCSP
jgi:hypothetical protein